MRSNRKVGDIFIAGRPVGLGHPCFIIAEIAQGHDGSLGTAFAYIDAVAKTGADAIKFQTHLADAESTPGEGFRVKVFPQDQTRYDYWKRIEFSPEQWAALADHAEQRGLIFLSTPFSMEAVELLETLQVAAWKIGSGEIGNLPMLERIALTGKPVLLSSGMSPWQELDDAIACIQAVDGTTGLFQCTTSYPCPPEQLGLNIIDEMRERYHCPVGLSDHSGTIYASVAAATLGVHMIEVHTVFSEEVFGPDVTSSITTSELAKLVEGVRFVEKAMLNPVDKDLEAQSRTELRTLFGKSLFAAGDLPSGHCLTADDIALKKPGSGMPANQFANLVGRTLKRPYKYNEPFSEKDVE